MKTSRASGTFSPDLKASLDVDHQDDTETLGHRPADRLGRRAVEVAVDLGRLEQLAADPLELLGGEKEIIAVRLLAGPRLPGRRRDRHAQAAGRAGRASARTSVLFPDPDGPEITTNRPGSRFAHPSSPSLDILDQLANLFQESLDLDHRAADLARRWPSSRSC